MRSLVPPVQHKEFCAISSHATLRRFYVPNHFRENASPKDSRRGLQLSPSRNPPRALDQD